MLLSRSDQLLMVINRVEEEAAAFCIDVQNNGFRVRPVVFAARLSELLPMTGKFRNLHNADRSVFML